MKMILKCILQVALLSFLIVSPAPPSEAVVEPKPSEVLAWAKTRAREHPGLREKLKEMNDSYEVLFIPGILGSKLEINGFTYGEDKIKAKKLLLDPDKSVRTAILEKFEAKGQYLGTPLGKYDIYGTGLDLLQLAVGGRKLYEFPYDWRQDIDRIADALQDFGKKELAGKRVIIVAHSMGGMVAWHWKNKYQDARPFTLAALVLLGSPLQGTCEIVRMLVKGYRPPEHCGTAIHAPSWEQMRSSRPYRPPPPEYKCPFTELAYWLVFGDAHAAIFTKFLSPTLWVGNLILGFQGGV